MRGFLNFIKYNNAVPIALGVIFLGAGSAFAASNPEALYNAQQQIVSIDNSYIVNKDLSTYTPRAQITSVEEDQTSYFISYTLATVDLKDYRWQDVQKTEVMQVSKADLGPYRDLGVYVTQQLKQIVGREVTYLGQVQEKERRQVSQAMVATTYGGLIGRFLDSSTEVLPGYVPVVVAPPEERGGAGGSTTGVASNGGTSAGSGDTQSTGSVQIGIQVLGNNPARIPLGSSYVDLGAVLLDPYNTNVGIHIYMNGHETPAPSVDTSVEEAYSIEYRATDLNGNTIVARRIVLVGEAVDPGGEVSAVGNLLPAQAPAPAAAPTTPVVEGPAPTVTEPAASTTPSTPTPEPTPEPVVEPEPTSEPEPTPTPAPQEPEPAVDTAAATSTPN